jgi:dephospho-CoA kinase
VHHISKKHPIILTFVGMTGAGKSACVDYLEAKGYPSVYFGGITVGEVKRRGLEVNETNEKMVREELRSTEGKDVMAKRIAVEIEHLANAGQTHIVADGLYSWSEYKFFKERFGSNAVIVAVTAPRHTRHERLMHRPVRPFTREDAIRREYNEIENIEKGGPIANADFTIVNDGGLDDLYKKLDALLRNIDFYS